jgi:hypothetical protein
VTGLIEEIEKVGSMLNIAIESTVVEATGLAISPAFED